MHKFFVKASDISNNTAAIKDDDVKHIYKVLRLSEGDRVTINNCKGKEYLGEIIDIKKNEVLVRLLEEVDVNNESSLEVYLYQGLPKSTKMDLIVQKATELGVREITPIITERVIVKNELGEYKKLDRLQKIALEACKQSKRSLIPEINAPLNFNEFLNELKAMDVIVVPYENAEGYGIKKLINSLENKNVRKAAVVIGPEGGFEEGEIIKLKGIGAHIVTLGPRILRTETAGFVCTSLLMYELGDIGGEG